MKLGIAQISQPAKYIFASCKTIHCNNSDFVVFMYAVPFSNLNHSINVSIPFPIDIFGFQANIQTAS